MLTIQTKNTKPKSAAVRKPNNKPPTSNKSQTHPLNTKPKFILKQQTHHPNITNHQIIK